jgi:hypothetical protein
MTVRLSVRCLVAELAAVISSLLALMRIKGVATNHSQTLAALELGPSVIPFWAVAPGGTLARVILDDDGRLIQVKRTTRLHHHGRNSVSLPAWIRITRMGQDW